MSQADLFPVKSLNPPLKYAGGKRWLVPHISPYWHKFTNRRLVEPFCGGLAVTLGLLPATALLNDINPHVMNFYRWIKKGLIVRIRLANEEELFYEHRTRFNQLLKDGQGENAEAAALFYYLNRTGFNGLCRFNRSGEFNVPFGKYKSINYVADFTAHQRLFKHWKFESIDFQQLTLADDDFIYADPPYDAGFTQYAKEAFGWEEQVRTAEWLARHKGPVLLSNQATDQIVELYQRLGFTLRYIQGPRRISCTGDRTPVKEVLAAKNFA